MKSEQAGTEVRCWNCHEMVLVPDSHQGQRVARELSDGALVVIKGPGFQSVLLAALTTTVLLTIPYVGVWCAMVGLMMGASAYGEIIRSVRRGSTEEPDPSLLSTLIPRSIPKIILCALMAAGTVVPLWLLNAKLYQSPHFNAIGRIIAATTWVLAPLLMVVVYGRTVGDGPRPFRDGLKLLARHPFATILALSVVPLTLLMVEIALGSILYLTGNLHFFALDFMPMPLEPTTHHAPVVYGGIPYYDMVEYRSYPTSMFQKGYLDGLRHGYSFVGAMPASLSMSTRAGLDAADAIGLMGPFYLVIRLLFVVVIVTCLLAAFAIQARWLGSIPALERNRPAGGLPSLTSRSDGEP